MMSHLLVACKNVVQAYFYLKIEILQSFYSQGRLFFFWLREFTLTLEFNSIKHFIWRHSRFTQLDETCKLNVYGFKNSVLYIAAVRNNYYYRHLMWVYKERGRSKRTDGYICKHKKAWRKKIPSMPLSLYVHVCGFWIRLWW